MKNFPLSEVEMLYVYASEPTRTLLKKHLRRLPFPPPSMSYEEWMRRMRGTLELSPHDLLRQPELVMIIDELWKKVESLRG